MCYDWYKDIHLASGRAQNKVKLVWLQSPCAYITTTRSCVLCLIINLAEGFPGGAVVKNLPAKVGDTGLNPGPGRSHMPQSN